MKAFFSRRLQNRNQYIISAAVIVGVALICYALSGVMGYRVAALVMLLAVSLLAVIFDILPVLFSAVLSAFIWGFFFIPPRFTIHVDNTEDAILLLMYFVIALISGVLTYKIREMEKKLRLKEERANSVTLYNTILNSLSHELRTPIAAIIGATDNLQTNSNLTADNKKLLVDEIAKASFRLNQQVENLLNISRLESGHIEPKKDWCDVQELVYEIAKRVEESNISRRVNVSINNNLPLCRLDKGMLDQILYNLLNNAAIHTPAQSRIDINVMVHADMLKIIVEDDGPGFLNIPVKNVFKKLSRYGGSTNSGSGLGLSIVKGFTEALNGTIELRNKNTGGAEFTIWIPVQTEVLESI
jgi:two-component system sensor histidine kinase KdpD